MRCHVASLSLLPPSSASLHSIPRSPCPLAQPAPLLEPLSSPPKLFLQNLALNYAKRQDSLSLAIPASPYTVPRTVCSSLKCLQVSSTLFAQAAAQVSGLKPPTSSYLPHTSISSPLKIPFIICSAPCTSCGPCDLFPIRSCDGGTYSGWYVHQYTCFRYSG
jgi:hypothetical protein